MGVFTSKIFYLSKSVSTKFYFFYVFSDKGERFLQNFCYQQGKNRGPRSKMDSKIDTFGQIDIRVLANLGVEKVVFWTFSKLF